MAIVGYARVSSRGQSLAVQRDQLAHCDRLYEEKMSGTDTARPELAACLNYVREGDALVVTRLDRLARSVAHLCRIAAELDRKGVQLQVIDQQIDTGTPTGRLLFHMLAAIAQFENELRRDRQAEGIQLCRSRGVRLGAPRLLNSAQVAELQTRRSGGETIPALSSAFGIKPRTVYKYLSLAE